ncbi:MAG: hypothetical protein MH186_00335 [Marinobacter sp.]|nr:hypothetical protein [Marinobacter sp.]
MEIKARSAAHAGQEITRWHADIFDCVSLRYAILMGNFMSIALWKKILRKIFQPILRIFESGDGEYRYEKSHRKILIAMGVLFLVLSTVSAVLAISSSEMGGLIPFLVFFYDWACM